MWVTLIMFLLTYLTKKRAGASDTDALMTAGLVGAGTYYATTQTDWGKATLGKLNASISGETKPILDANGKVVLDAGGNPMMSSSTSLFDLFKSWGATGTATVVGAAGVATGAISPTMIYVGLGLAAILLLK